MLVAFKTNGILTGVEWGIGGKTMQGGSQVNTGPPRFISFPKSVEVGRFVAVEKTRKRVRQTHSSPYLTIWNNPQNLLSNPLN